MTDVIQQYNQAERLKDEGKLDEAVALLTQIVTAHPEHVLSHLTLGRIFTLQGKHDEAIEHGQRACQLEPSEPFNFTALSVTYQRAFAGTQNHAFIQLAEDAMAESRRLESMR